MKNAAMWMAICLCMVLSSSLSGLAWRRLLLTENGEEVGTQEFKLTRSSESGKLFMASKAKGIFPGGKGRFQSP